MSRLNALYALLLLATRFALGAIQFQQPDDLPKVEYDYIVIGGGTAGAVVATRLSERPNVKVLVIEAGPSNDDVFATHPPGLARELAGTRVDWNYTVVPQPGLNNRVTTYGRARMLGGCSSHNGFVYTRGSRDDYDRWASVTRDDNLSYEKILPYILKTEKWIDVDSEHQDVQGHFDPAFHSKTGKVSVSGSYLEVPFNNLLFEAASQLKEEFPFKLDQNDGRPIGISWGQLTIDGHGERSSSATGYLSTAGANVHVLLNTLVTRVLPTKNGDLDLRKVEFATSANSARTQLIAKKEVILSGGVINTPQILLNSGIGSKAQLNLLGIKTLVDNPSVGKNFSDQTAVRITFATSLPATTTTALAEWEESRTGPLSHQPHVNPLGWVRLPDDAEPFRGGVADPSAGRNSPHIELSFDIIGVNPAPPVGLPALVEDPNSDIVLQMFVVNLNPVSRGSISLASSDPFAHPLIDTQMLSNPLDLAILREGIRSIRRLLSAPVLNNTFFGTVTPPANVTADAELDAFIRNASSPFLHSIGSAAMSPRGARWGVVDPDFRVKGTKGLRIVDASIIPFVTAGHTQAPVYAIAEWASEVIKRG